MSSCSSSSFLGHEAQTSERLGQLEGLTSSQVKVREAETFHLNERQAPGPNPCAGMTCWAVTVNRSRLRGLHPKATRVDEA